MEPATAGFFDAYSPSHLTLTDTIRLRRIVLRNRRKPALQLSIVNCQLLIISVFMLFHNLLKLIHTHLLLLN